MTSKPPAAKPPAPKGELTKLRQSEAVEGNILEYPLFSFASRPRGEGEGIEHFTRTIELTKSETEDKSLTLVAHPSHGFPTQFAHRVLIALITIARETDPTFATPRVYFTRNDLAKRLGHSEVNGATLRAIEEALSSLQWTKYQFKRLWYDSTSKKTIQDTQSFALLSLETGMRVGKPGPKPLGGQLALKLGAVEEPRGSYVEFGRRLQENLKAHYVIGVSLPFMNSLGREPLAMRLYSYLAKKDAGPQYSENVDTLIQKMGLTSDQRKERVRLLKRALDVLTSAVELEDQSTRFLERWDLAKSGVVTVHFWRPAGSPAEFRRPWQPRGPA